VKQRGRSIDLCFVTFVCLYVCSALSLSLSKKVHFWHAVRTSSKSSGQVRVGASIRLRPRSLKQKAWNLIPPLPFRLCLRSMAQSHCKLQWWQVHFSHSGYDTICSQPCATPRVHCTLQIADPQPAGRVCGLRISDLHTDRVIWNSVSECPVHGDLLLIKRQSYLVNVYRRFLSTSSFFLRFLCTYIPTLQAAACRLLQHIMHQLHFNSSRFKRLNFAQMPTQATFISYLLV